MGKVEKFVEMFKELGFYSTSYYCDWKNMDSFYFERVTGELFLIDKRIKTSKVVMFKKCNQEINIYGEITYFNYGNCHRDSLDSLKNERYAMPLDIDLLDAIYEAKKYLDWKEEKE